jgi:Ca2+-binding RTX toxin-like protein
VVRAGGGNDRVIADSGTGGGSAADRVWGGAGADELTSTDGQDVVNGGDGNDIIDDMGASADVLRGGAGDDQLIGEVAESALPQVYAGGPGKDRLDLFSNLINPGAAPGDGRWDMSTGEMFLDIEAEQALTASGLEVADLSTFGLEWDVTGTEGADELSGGSLPALSFTALGGDDTFLGSAGDDLFDGGLGNDRSLGMGVGDDECVSVEVFDVDDCETITP